MYEVRDINLWKEGERKIQWAKQHMPVLNLIRERFKEEKPFKGITIGMALHLEAKTAVLAETLMEGGAEIAITGCNPLSTQDDVAAACAKKGMHVYAWRGETVEEYYENLNKVLDHKPDIVIDDGCDLIFLLHTKRTELLDNIMGGCEETTTGIIRLKAMEKEGALKFPVMDVNDAYTKHLFDNRYGTGQSALDGILRATNLLIAGKTVVVAGYGWCGRGVAMRAKGLGAEVVVTEVNPIRALEARMDGFRVMKMEKAAEIGDIFITTTGCKDVIRKEHILKMRNGAILANAGHFDNEINKKHLEELAKSIKEVRNCVTEYDLGNKKIYLLGEGRLVNLACADGHPCEVMDMSFANQALAAEYILKNHEKLEPRVYNIPYEQDLMIASLKLKAMGIEIDELTKEQKKYLEDWREGT
ncbi:TPA: adenosylhomocysteinase [Methanocaldococcus jannaschii]|uniref:S-inosyl-L-homocysteine hydrolase n=2 Tax=Methanocaldococcus jannaschii TaxID=2190 RepID=SIHH_METJA|nr:adenosylhomocysteinase [Methanocaldococcus jannaschii]Q58783.1 RecName: Full=S-inosyl-L-homocysteine hydrolase; Short=SIHH [Methanocaldococcus jannaschii DSM 2661]AAB99397.1 adenosylhomocysteinase (ahcY) [Methanocaldococcus jannaschii DSM 2661]HII59864.1 adenosylhomocysteinase [Methanocaldococcus jannaschii]